MTTFAQELRQAWRSLLRRKAYFLTCAATLTLVLGANAAQAQTYPARPITLLVPAGGRTYTVNGQQRTAFTITIDAAPQFGVTTGLSAQDRATTIRLFHRLLDRLRDLVGVEKYLAVDVPRGASGSSMISPKLRVSIGAPLHCRGGDTSSPSHVNRAGILSPYANAADVSCI